MQTVHEVSRLTGISVRALHHYDAIGLLKPSRVTEAGYRLYDGAALRRLQNILFFRELQFPLKEIKAILDNPEFDPKEALDQQIRLLELQRTRIDRLISLAREAQKGGTDQMNFQAFQKKGRTDEEMEMAADRMMSLFAEMGSIRELPPGSREAQEKVRELQAFITENYYTCTDEILRGLGEMYVSDERMKRNIDQAGGEGTAEFVSQAIAWK